MDLLLALVARLLLTALIKRMHFGLSQQEASTSHTRWKSYLPSVKGSFLKRPKVNLVLLNKAMLSVSHVPFVSVLVCFDELHTLPKSLMCTHANKIFYFLPHGTFSTKHAITNRYMIETHAKLKVVY
jgi:hypothetical protein